MEVHQPDDDDDDDFLTNKPGRSLNLFIEPISQCTIRDIPLCLALLDSGTRSDWYDLVVNQLRSVTEPEHGAMRRSLCCWKSGLTEQCDNRLHEHGEDDEEESY